MPVMAVIAANVLGDIGGTGISRFHVKRTDGTAPIIADCNAAAAAIRAWLLAAGAFIPTGIQWQFPVQVPLLDEVSAELQGYLNLGVIPNAVIGSGAGAYPAGNGCRVDWLTATIRNRRLMRAANFLVPFASQGFAPTGQIATAAQTAVQTASGVLLGALSTAGLSLVAYHRPAKGTIVGGVAAPVTAYRVPATPATLRSRRT